MIYKYLLSGFIFLVLCFVWYGYLRNRRLYGDRTELDDFFEVKDEVFDFNDKIKKIEGDILFAFLGLYGVIALYNALAIWFNWQPIFEVLYEWFFFY